MVCSTCSFTNLMLLVINFFVVGLGGAGTVGGTGAGIKSLSLGSFFNTSSSTS